ncbi:uncharacterized protein FA14DRAFT_162292, partial [Meira miltonrushii]
MSAYIGHPLIDNSLLASIKHQAKMAGPAIIDPKRHYNGGMSDLERKMAMMQQMMGTEDDDVEEEEEEDVKGKNVVGNSSPMANLPIEIVEKILEFATLPESWQKSQVSSTDAMLRASIRLSNAYRLCLICRQFDQLVRPKMYKSIHIAHRKIRPLLRTLQTSAKLASFIKEVTLSSHIWTSDVNEDVIAQLFIAIRPYCIRLTVGANESGLLPYLFYGEPESEEESEPAAIQVLHITWRDEMDYDPRMIRAEEREEEEMLAETGEASSISARQSLLYLFEHDPQRILEAGKFDNRAFSHLQHLTLNVYSQAQLDQLFTHSGYFVETILPLLTFLRIELPLSTLQCGVEDSRGGRGAIARHWPTQRFLFHGRRAGGDGASVQQVEEIKSVVEEFNRKLEREKDTLVMNSHTSEEERIKSETIALMPCVSVLLRSLLTRLALNVHRNDMTLFSLLLDGSYARESNWSTRSTVAASILAQSLQRHLSTGKTDFDPFDSSEHGLRTATSITPITFPLHQLRGNGIDSYWSENWEEAERESNRHLPIILGGMQETHDVDQTNHITKEQEDRNVKVSLLLRWPTALDAFFRYAAMV